MKQATKIKQFKRKNLLLLAVILCVAQKNSGALGCLDHSYHVERDYYYEGLDSSIYDNLQIVRNEKDYPLDSKKWYVTECSCPCENYRASYLKDKTGAMGLCVICYHRGPLDRTSAQNSKPDNGQFNKSFALLGAIVNKKQK